MARRGRAVLLLKDGRQPLAISLLLRLGVATVGRWKRVLKERGVEPLPHGGGVIPRAADRFDTNAPACEDQTMPSLLKIQGVRVRFNKNDGVELKTQDLSRSSVANVKVLAKADRDRDGWVTAD